NGNLIIPIGSKGIHGNGHIILDAEFRQYADHFGIDRILTKSEITEQLLRTEIAKIRDLYSELIDDFTVAELDNLVTEIESRTGLDLVTSGLLKQDKIDLIKDTLGMMGI
ncbi:MAG: hypothetical protein U9N34_10405, partial [Candidatus Cloacimonadota bacterium]|nr:hypothetical protein [Candidatus Cloacimonadota bacterium]